MDLKDIGFCSEMGIFDITTLDFIPCTLLFGVFSEVMLDLILLEQFLQILFIIFPIFQIIVSVEVQFLVFGFVLPEGPIVHLFVILTFEFEALDDIILLLYEYVEFLQFLIYGEEVGPED